MATNVKVRSAPPEATFEYAEVSELIATEISEIRFGEDGRQSNRGGGFELSRMTFHVEDIEQDCEDLQIQYRLLHEAGFEHMYGRNVLGGLPVPEDLASYGLEVRGISRRYARADPDILDQVKMIADQLENDPKVVRLEYKDALKGFSDWLGRFLTVRSKGSPPDKLRGRNRVVHETLPYTVHSRRKKGRVYSSPAYFRNHNAVFGSPSTPSDGWIRPGIYVFGVQYPEDEFPDFDENGRYEIPDSVEAHLMI